MTADRIKEIQNETAFPDSVSVCQALMKVWNECEQAKEMGKEQTAVDWLIDQYEQTLGKSITAVMNDEIAIAKAMGKEQIREAHFTGSGYNSFDMPTNKINSAYKDAEQYYNQTFKKD
jgi:hypothetical protein